MKACSNFLSRNGANGACPSRNLAIFSESCIRSEERASVGYVLKHGTFADSYIEGAKPLWSRCAWERT